MLQLIGIKSNCTVEIREQLSIIPKHSERTINELLGLCKEVVVLSTCNRTEIYFDCEISDEGVVEEIFIRLGWNKEFINYIFRKKEEEVTKHLMELSCGFYSKILGEDQILGQIKKAYEEALKLKAVSRDLQRLFQLAITCGKEFRDKAELYKTPVSSSSIVVKEALTKGAKKFMVLGYGEVGQLTCKYILSSSFENLYIIVRNGSCIDITDDRIRVIPFEQRKYHYKDVDCIISCTSAPHTVVSKNDLPDKKLVIYDLAVPRDVDNEVASLEQVEVYDIDKISLIDDENKKIREQKMNEFKYIVDKYIKEYKDWQCIKEITPQITKIKITGEKIYSKRYNTFVNKKHTKDNEVLARTLLKSTSDAYVNKAIEVLKEEHLKGRGEECLKIIQRIFCQTS